ncbi:MAG: glutamine-hydrolyzing carbamoyl-phosphate synthase small subunit [Proteiniphilum sp.]|jgi:carbamoyl-phosphate synthase small subunit|nr:glutamine-hydrolyzing carbamoyl-phosphate synthase small subunit [Proteiniphilum sp.]
MYKNRPVRLILENGMIFHGQSFGAEKATSGEVVFSTAMVGYPESLTDPSYEGQILTLTYPIIGNYGVPAYSETDGISDFFESSHIHAKGLIVQDRSDEYSHWNGKKSLNDWLREEGIPAVSGIDTRMLTKILREKGAMLGKIVSDEEDEADFYDPETENLVARASCREVMEYGPRGAKKVVLVDCGAKLNIVRELVRQQIHLIRVPWDYDFNEIDYDGLMISNGPGNPDHCTLTVARLREAMKKEKPIFGICMGNQLLAKAAGAEIYKLKYGHRSHNQPVRMVGSNRCFVTSQNHGYAVDESRLGAGWEPWFLNMNDGTNEGIRHKTKPFCSVQFHPEAAGGPTDTRFFFGEFVKML